MTPDPEPGSRPAAGAPRGGVGSVARIVVSIVSYRTGDLVAAALPPLLEELSGFERSAVLIVDNASPDGDGDRLAGHLERLGEPSVRLIRSPRNGGFAAGNNLAFAALGDLGWTPDAVLLLNPDAAMRPGALREMARVMERGPRVGVVGARLENPDGSTWVAAFRFPSMMGEFARDAGGPFVRRWPVLAEDMEAPGRVDWVSGAAMLVRRELIDDLGGMDEGYFLYFEEIDFMLQATRAGWEVWHAPAALILHDPGGSTGLVDGKPKRGPMPAYWFDSWRRYFEKNHGPAYASGTAALKLLGLGLGAARQRLKGRPASLPPGFAASFARRCLLGREAR